MAARRAPYDGFMARATIELVVALRRTAARLDEGATFQWSHFANCNCGHLAQTITDLDPRLIYEAAFERPGDWGEQAREYCPTSRMPMDAILGKMYELGMEPTDVRHLERLDDPRVLARLPEDRRRLRKVDREHAVTYMRAWADLLEAQLPARVVSEPAPSATLDPKSEAA